MELSRAEKYKGHEIRIFLLPPIGSDQTYRAKYEVQLIGSKRMSTGVIAGAFHTAHDAEEGALKAAKLAIETVTDHLSGG